MHRYRSVCLLTTIDSDAAIRCFAICDGDRLLHRKNSDMAIPKNIQMKKAPQYEGLVYFPYQLSLLSSELNDCVMRTGGVHLTNKGKPC